MKKNLFITFEGIEGSGKSTQSKKLQEFFLQNKIESILTREPGGCEIAEQIRKILLDEKFNNMQAVTEILLNFSARLEHVEQVIKPALKQGKVVICDRFFDSTYAYQGSAHGVDFSVIEKIHKITLNDFEPDITFLIDVDVEQAFARINSRIDNNRYEKLGLEFHQKVRSGFLKLADKNQRIKKIDGSQNIEQILLEIIKHL
jgi:dTMP kinase